MTNIRDGFIGECCRKKIPVTAFATNGFQVKGVILAFDGTTVVLLQNDGKQAMMFMSAISTIIPVSPALTSIAVRDYNLANTNEGETK